MTYDLVVVGAGAGGCFAAIRLAEFLQDARICVLEAAKRPLSKVEISGGGRCNVTHACFDVEKLSTYYPRGHRELIEPFKEFQPKDLINWFREKNIRLKTESDGRMFPVTDSSSTVIDCFMQEMRKNQIELRTSVRVQEWSYDADHKFWNVLLMNGQVLQSKNVLLSSGSDQRIWNALSDLGYSLIKPVPSLFTFNIREESFNALMGITKEHVFVSIPKIKMKAQGPLLITHWGVSGPAILKLSAWGARELYDVNYVFDLQINWIGSSNADDLIKIIQNIVLENPKKFIHNYSVKNFPSRLWKYLCQRAGIGEFTSGAEFGKKQIKRLTEIMLTDTYRVTGKSTFKEEFVTAGGVSLDEISLVTFESKRQPGLYMVGEMLNIDAVTGGFNFQAAWTGAHIVAKAIAQKQQ